MAPYDDEESSSSGNRLKMRLKEFHRRFLNTQFFLRCYHFYFFSNFYWFVGSSAASFSSLDRNYLTPFFTTQTGDRDDNDDSNGK